MKTDEADKLIATIRSLMESDGDKGRTTEDAGKMLGRVAQPMVVGKKAKESLVPGEARNVGDAPPDGKPFDDVDKERFYQQIKERILSECPMDPVLLHLVTQRPEIQLQVERRVIELDGSTVRGKIAIVIGAGFFKEPREPKAIRTEIARTQGTEPHPARLSDALRSLVADGVLTREESNVYQLAPGAKITKTTVESAS